MEAVVSMPLRVVLFSYSSALIEVLDTAATAAGHRVVGVITTRGPKRRRSADYLSIVERFAPRCTVIVSNQPGSWAGMVRALQPDLLMSMGFPWRIPAEVLAIPTLGAINGHPSLLPNYRGAGPNVFGWLFRNDERETGFTVHRMDGDFDTGSILAQERVPVTDEDDFASLAAKIGAVAPRAFQHALEAVARGESGIPQEPGAGFYVDWFEDAWQTIDWSQPARHIHNQVRSWTGLETPRGAVGEIDGQRVRVIKTRLLDRDDLPQADPGCVLTRENDTIVIQCGDRPLELLVWQEEPALLVSPGPH